MYNILHHFPVWLSIKLVCVEGQGEGSTLNFFKGVGVLLAHLFSFNVNFASLLWTKTSCKNIGYLTKKLFSLNITATAVVTHQRDNYNTHPSLPSLQSCSSRIWDGLICNFGKGVGQGRSQAQDHGHATWAQLSVSRWFLQLVVA